MNNKDKRGFTLIELLGVIIILGIVLMVAFPAVSKYMKRGTIEYYHSLEKEIKTAGMDYLETYRSLLPRQINNVTVVPLEELVNNKYMEEVKDENGDLCTGQVAVKKIKTDSYEYYSCLVCGDEGKVYDSGTDLCSINEGDNEYKDSEDYTITVEKDYYEVVQSTSFTLPTAKVWYKYGTDQEELVEDSLEGSPNKINTDKLGKIKVLYYYRGAKKEITVEVVDETAPSKPEVVLKEDNASGKIYLGAQLESRKWYSGNIYQEFKSTDYTKPGVLGSGIKEYQISTTEDFEEYDTLDSNYQITTDTGYYKYYVRSVDKSGNSDTDTSDSTSYVFWIDKKAPECEIVVTSGTEGKNGWYTSDVTVKIQNIKDEHSGISFKNGELKAEGSTKTINYNTAGVTISTMLTDNAGNIGVCSKTVKIDKEKPDKPVIAASDGKASGLWHTANFTLSISGANNISGNTYYYGNTGDLGSKYNGAISVNGDTDSKVYYANACSGAGVCSDGNASYTVKLDTVKPTCTWSGENDSWTNSTVNVTATCKDDTSKCSATTASKTWPYSSGATKTASLSYEIKDNAGNSATCSKTVNVYFDKVAPTCTWTGGNNSWTTSTVSVTSTCNDDNSKCDTSTASKTWTYSSGTTKTVALTYVVKDNAGNSTRCINDANIYIDKEGPTIPLVGSIGSVSGSSTTGSVQTDASGSTDNGVGNITYKYLIKNNDTTPSNTDSGFTNSKNFTRSCGTSYYAWAIAVDGLGNKSSVKYLGTTSDGANSYSGWSACSKTCGGGTQTRTNTCSLVTTGLSQNCNTQACCSYAAGTSWPFDYTGGIQSFSVPCNGTYKLEVWGAQGGASHNNHAGGGGGYSVGNIVLNNSTTLYIGVGGQGEKAVDRESDDRDPAIGGYNGGGTVGVAGLIYADIYNNGNGAGGGATHIAKDTNRGELKNYINNKSEILIVAGGGGGGGESTLYTSNPIGGTGGGETGGNGTYGEEMAGVGTGGTQTTSGCTNGWTCQTGIGYSHCGGGGFGYGSNTNGPNVAAAGGGGWYGGGCGGNYNGGRPGGGGSGYIGGVTGGTMQNGQRAGNGYAKITLVTVGN